MISLKSPPKKYIYSCLRSPIVLDISIESRDLPFFDRMRFHRWHFDLLHHEYPGFRAILKLCDGGAAQGLPCDLPRGPSAPHDLVP